MSIIDSFNINGTLYNLRDAVAVLFGESQNLSDIQKNQARENIEAPKSSAIAPDHRYIAYNLSAGSYALHNGELYQALVDIPAGELWTPAHWEHTDIAIHLKNMGDQIADLNYAPIEITSLEITTPANGIAEIGSTVISEILRWTLNGTPITQTLDGASLSADQRQISKGGSGSTYTSDHTFILTATDAGSPSHSAITATRTVTLRFYNNIIYGVAALSTVDSAFVNGLANKILTGTKSRTITVNAGSNQYIWYALPKRLGICSFNVGGFDGGFEAPQTASITNGSGYIEEYYVYRSTNANLGSTTIKVS